MFCTYVKPGMFWLGIASKETFLAYSTHFVFLTIRFVPGNVVIVAINMCGKSPTTEEWIHGISWKHVYLNIFVHFTVDTTFILKLAFLLLFVSVLLQGHLGGCVVAIIVDVVIVVFICLFIYLFRFSVYLFFYLFFLSLRPLFLSLLSLLLSLLLLLLLMPSLPLCVRGYCCS